MTISEKETFRVMPREETTHSRRWWALLMLGLVQFIIVIDTTVVNVALPSIQHDLHVAVADLAWVVDGYLLAAGGLLLLGGRLADLFGRRRLFLIGTALFALASLSNGVAQSPLMLIVSRFAQGAGEALASPAALSLITLLFVEKRERARAFGIWGGITGLGATVGVVLSGIILELVNWRWVFFINLPFAVAALLIVPRLIEESRAAPGKPGRIDFLGAVLVTGGLIAVVDGLFAAARFAWSDGNVLVPLLGGLGALLAFVLVEARSAEPLMPLRFFANRTRATANLLTVFLNSALMVMFFILTLYMQNILGYTALSTGVAYLPFCITFPLGVFLSIWLAQHAGIKLVLVIAFLISALGLLLLSRISVQSSYSMQVLPAMLMLAVGFGMALPTLQNAAVDGVSQQNAGLASGMQNTVQALGAALGLATLVTIALRDQGDLLAQGILPQLAATESYQLAFSLGAIILAVGAVLSLLLIQGRQTGSTLGRKAQPE